MRRFRFTTTSKPRAAVAGRAALIALALTVLCAAGVAQSGRRQPQPKSPVPEPSPAASPGANSSSESVSDSDAKKSQKDRRNAPLFSFYVLEDETINLFLDIPLSTSNVIVTSFVERLQDSPNVSVAAGGKGDRKRAHDHAKIERDVYTVLVQLDEEVMRGTSKRAGEPANINNLVVRYYVYEPQTATLKYQGQVYMRPYQASTRVGGVRIPLPTPRSNRLPIEYSFEQAGREAAERVMASFDIRIP
jgi:hypothetical protein